MYSELYVSPGTAVFIFWVSHPPTALVRGSTTGWFPGELIQASIRGRGSVVTSSRGLKILCRRRNKPTKQIQVGTLVWILPAVSVSEGRLGFLVTVSLPADRGSWNKPSETPTSVMMMRFSFTTSTTPCGRRLKRQRSLERSSHDQLAAGGCPADPEEWVGPVSSHHREWRQQVGSGWAEPVGANHSIVHAFPYASSRL